MEDKKIENHDGIDVELEEDLHAERKLDFDPALANAADAEQLGEPHYFTSILPNGPESQQ